MVKLVVETIQKCCSWCDLVVFENNLFFTMTNIGGLTGKHMIYGGILETWVVDGICGD